MVKIAKSGPMSEPRSAIGNGRKLESKYYHSNIVFWSATWQNSPPFWFWVVRAHLQRPSFCNGPSPQTLSYFSCVVVPSLYGSLALVDASSSLSSVFLFTKITFRFHFAPGNEAIKHQSQVLSLCWTAFVHQRSPHYLPCVSLNPNPNPTQTLTLYHLL